MGVSSLREEAEVEPGDSWCQSSIEVWVLGNKLIQHSEETVHGPA